jgi:squalene-hopene/tetraprenyl-beta-curcumene cyclase
MKYYNIFYKLFKFGFRAVPLLVFFFSFGNYTSIDISLKNDLEYSMKSAFRYLLSKQESNGSWQDHPAITGLVLSAFLRSNLPEEIKQSVAEKGFDFLKSCIKPDGSIYKDLYMNYSTSIALRAFKDASDPSFDSIIINAENFLFTLQFDESKGYSEEDLSYGGVGYGDIKPDRRPDLSNLSLTLTGLYDKTVPELEKTMDNKTLKHLQKKKQFYKRVLVFLSRCQNLKSVNHEIYATNDGGFMYYPDYSKAGGTKSYGSMTYAGLLSMLYAYVDKNDPRVLAAVNWLSQNYSISENPGLGAQGLYYYYHTMAKALNSYSEDTLLDSEGNKHDWQTELASELIRLKKPDGYWKNEIIDTWMEDNEILVTSYVLLAMEEILDEQIHQIPLVIDIIPK